LSTELGKYPPVFAQNVVYIPNGVVCIAVQLVVVGISALIGAKFFIYPPNYLLSTL